jgi:hypothetical protein
VLGSDHPHTLNTCSKLATAYENTGSKAKAIAPVPQTVQRLREACGSGRLQNSGMAELMSLACRRVGANAATAGRPGRARPSSISPNRIVTEYDQVADRGYQVLD